MVGNSPSQTHSTLWTSPVPSTPRTRSLRRRLSTHLCHRHPDLAGTLPFALFFWSDLGRPLDESRCTSGLDEEEKMPFATLVWGEWSSPFRPWGWSVQWELFGGTEGSSPSTSWSGPGTSCSGLRTQSGRSRLEGAAEGPRRAPAPGPDRPRGTRPGYTVPATRTPPQRSVGVGPRRGVTRARVGA